MSNLVDIQNQIEKLQKQAAQIKSREFEKTVQEIRAKMQAFGITAKDLQADGARKPRGKKMVGDAVKSSGVKKKKAGVAVAAKFRGPEGQEWSGRGLTPRWLAALIAQGQTKEEFAING